MSAIIGREGKNLPPTLGTLIPHVYRAFYSALLCKLAITLHPEIPHPTEYYWVCQLYYLNKYREFIKTKYENQALPYTHLSLRLIFF